MKKPRKKLIATIPIDIFNAEVLLLYNVDFIKEVKNRTSIDLKLTSWEESIKENFHDAVSIKIQQDAVYYIICLKSPTSPSSIAHECVHMAYHILGDRNIPINRLENETLAYLTGYLSSFIFKEIYDI